jgi:hypothetical protein
VTDRKDALTKLLAKVEAGGGVNYGYYSSAFASHDHIAHVAYNGSLDAAKALHEAVLPEWRVTHAFGLVSGEVAKFNLTHNEKPSTYVSAKSDNPARAWLIAIIKALIAD